MQKQPQLPYTMTAPSNYRRKWGSSTPHKRGDTAATLQRQWKAGRQQASPHPPASHAWLASCAPHTTSRQRRAATASMTASGHENGERDRGTASGHSNPLASKLKLLPWTTAAPAAIGHARALSEGPLAVGKPPPATPKPLERTLWNR